MRKLCLLCFLLPLLAVPVRGMEIAAPQAPAGITVSDSNGSFGEGLLGLVRAALEQCAPELRAGAAVCGTVAACAVLCSFAGLSETAQPSVTLAAAAAVSSVFFTGAKTMILLADETVSKLSEYGKLLLPVLTAALAAQGRVGTSAALYAGSAVFLSCLSAVLARLLRPLCFGFLALSVGYAATGDPLLQRLKKAEKALAAWVIKTALTVFTGYMTVTGVVSGTTDAATLKAAKAAVSALVPVVGGILSDASEAVLVGAGVAKNAVGVYGITVIGAIFLEPFCKIGVQYLLLHAASVLCGVFTEGRLPELVEDFGSMLGILLGCTAGICMMLLIGCICFLKGAG